MEKRKGGEVTSGISKMETLVTLRGGFSVMTHSLRPGCALTVQTGAGRCLPGCEHICYRVLEQRTHAGPPWGDGFVHKRCWSSCFTAQMSLQSQESMGVGDRREDDEGPDRQRGDHLWKAQCERPGVPRGGMEGERRPLSCVSMC